MTPRRAAKRQKQELEIEIVTAIPSGPADRARHLSRGTDVVTKAFDRVTIGLNQLKQEISDTITSLADSFKPGPDGPKSCEITFGLKVGAKGNVILAAIGSDVSLSVKLTWE